jgi:hypothetical protein
MRLGVDLFDETALAVRLSGGIRGVWTCGVGKGRGVTCSPLSPGTAFGSVVVMEPPVSLTSDFAAMPRP